MKQHEQDAFPAYPMQHDRNVDEPSLNERVTMAVEELADNPEGFIKISAAHNTTDGDYAGLVETLSTATGRDYGPYGSFENRIPLEEKLFKPVEYAGEKSVVAIVVKEGKAVMQSLKGKKRAAETAVEPGDILLIDASTEDKKEAVWMQFLGSGELKTQTIIDEQTRLRNESDMGLRISSGAASRKYELQRMQRISDRKRKKFGKAITAATSRNPRELR